MSGPETRTHCNMGESKGVLGLGRSEAKMAANVARRTLQFSSASAKTILNSSTTTATRSCPLASRVSELGGHFLSMPTSANRFSLHKLTVSRLPVELGGAWSLMPLHSVTASALFTSLLSLHSDNWGCLSEGFATPL